MKIWTKFGIMGVLFMLALSGCFRQTPATSTPLLPVGHTPSVFPWVDASGVMSGICFEAALDAAGQVFVLRDFAALAGFNDRVDASELCRRAVERNGFDFGGGRVLAGLWSAGMGCTARHDVLAIERDDGQKTLVIRLGFITEGDCDYELVRPFWIGLDAVADYAIEIVVGEVG